jgi:hypothetical protein
VLQTVSVVTPTWHRVTIHGIPHRWLIHYADGETAMLCVDLGSDGRLRFRDYAADGSIPYDTATLTDPPSAADLAWVRGEETEQ